ncbi:hypothetical protein BKA57DRAFT_455961 [Linnemannia elongata]|nr:hypothetical protein BKA57DRAFT_455961 [Linnemannia elongata]
MSGRLFCPYVLGISSAAIPSCLVPLATPGPEPDRDLDPTELVPVADSKCSRCDHHWRSSDRSNGRDRRVLSPVWDDPEDGIEIRRSPIQRSDGRELE